MLSLYNGLAGNRKAYEAVMKRENAEVETPSNSEGEAQGEAIIDLNRVFSPSNKDLNSLFPDPGFRRFLRDVKRNQVAVEKLLEKLGEDF